LKLLSTGSLGSDVTVLQRKLAAAGFNPGPADGDFGPLTKAAVLKYQRQNGLEVDGKVGTQTWGALFNDGFSPAKPPAPGSVSNTTPPRDGTLGSKMLALAESQVGTLESGTNRGDSLKYQRAFGRGPEAWCADFQSWLSTQSGGKMNDPYCPSVKDALAARGLWKGKHDPKPGDLVLFDWDGDRSADHIGIVKSVNANGTITTIEGNTHPDGGGQEGVWQRTRSLNDVLGFGTPY
jgi:peptidoglycan hydrolase-like protein with peptidoglycan-binding domain